MKIAIIDLKPETRAALLGRVNLAIEEAGIKSPELIDLNLNDPGEHRANSPDVCFIGPGSYSRLDDLIQETRALFKYIPIALVLENEIYANRGVALRKKYNLEVMPLGDVAHMAGFLMDAQRHESGAVGAGLIIGIAQLKGGVGATTVTTALGACWARHGVSSVIVDLDDVNPQITSWARVSSQRREAVGESIRKGQVTPDRINELLSPVEGYDGKLLAIGQPLLYNEGFHLKADVLDGAPSSTGYINTLLNSLRADFDTIILDLGRSWGVSTFAALPHCQIVLLVTDDDGMSVRQTLDNLQRLKAESGNSGEFDFTRWNVLLNAYTGRLISPEVLAGEIAQMNLMPPEASLYTIPFTETGRQWGAPGQSLFDLAEDSCRQSIIKIAFNLCPFGYTAESGVVDKLVGKFKQFVK